MQKILFISTNNIGSGLSGGDRIFLELARHWSSKLDITILGSSETRNLLKRYKVDTNFILADRIDNSPILIHQIRRVFKSIYLILKNRSIFSKYNYVYSVSDFYPDFLPAFFIKMLFPKIKWIAGFYLFAPNPLSSKSPYIKTHQFYKGLIYYLGQIPVYFIVKIFADIIFVTSNPDIQKFNHKKVIVVRGGVDTTASTKFLKSNNKPKKIYDAVFIGRLHPQKGVLELIDIWQNVVSQLPSAKLAIIGNGELEKQVKFKIKNFKLTNNIKLLGFLDGTKKYTIFKSSKIVVHPAIYDSGGMAAAEAMAWGLPGVSFDLLALKTYYPQGMIKVPCFNFENFSQMIIELLSNQDLYQKTSQKSINLINKSWAWPKQADRILNQIT